MDKKIPKGYKLIELNALLFRSENSIVLRCIRENDNIPVVCKTTNEEFPSELQKNQMNRDFEISQLLTSNSGVLNSYERCIHNKTVVLVMEDFSAIDLKKYLRTLPDNKMDVVQFLQFALHISSTLSEIHQNRILHLDIKPQNILINPDTKELKICDFSMSEIVSIKTPFVSQHDGNITGTVYYMSPEQTGKIANAKIDTRSDIYSLGATFYHLLSGRVPFDSSDISEIIHSHIAKSTEPIDGIPKSIQLIIDHMMEKSADSRYQTMTGVLKDLEDVIKNSQHLPEYWIPGANDIPDTFSLSNKVYGRDEELLTLDNVINMIEVTKQPAIVLISGFSGIGKSVLVQELKFKHPSGLVFASGKYDQINRGVPYSAIISSINELVNKVLGENKTTIAEIKLKLLEYLGDDGALLIDLVPQLELIIGKQTSVGDISGTELTNRLFDAVISFYRVFISEPTIL
jgi:serine/threonine protein kinase